MSVNRESLWDHLKVLCEEIGPRLSGTPADERTVEYIAGHFRRSGAQVEVQDFPCPSWNHEATELTLLVKDGPEPLPAFAQTFTEACDVEAQLVGVGTRHELEYAPDLEGKVLVLYGEAAVGLNLDRNLTLLSVEERQPAAAIVISPHETVPTKLIRDPFLCVPAAAVPQSVGLKLRQNEGGRVRLRIQARRYDSTGHNVIGRVPGKEKGRIVVAAHYDTAAYSPGATDNASGTAVVLELCNIFARAGTRRLGLDFVAYGGHEYGRHGGNLGSVQYVRRHPVEIKETCGIIEADVIGTATGSPRVRVMGWPARQRDDILCTLRQFPRYIVNVRPETEAPRTALNLAGVPALVFVNDVASVPIHTAQDTIGLMNPDELAFSAEVIAAVVDHVSSA
jgi:aminopeptidase YwaD